MGGALAVAAAGVVAAGCAPGAHDVARRATTTTTTTPTTTAVTVPSVPTTAPTTTVGPSFPAVVVQAMSQFQPLAAGAEAPLRLPQEPGYITAQTGGLGGQDNVTLVVTAQPVPVDSPQLSTSQTTELASFATTATASASTAQGQLAQQRNLAIGSCGGAAQPLTLADGTAATTCPTLDGAAVTWQHDGWAVQVVTLSGQAPSTSEASQIESALGTAPLPASAGGFVSVQVPANASVGSSTTAAVEWAAGADDYQVRSTDDPVGALEVASAMRPYPGG